MGRLIPRLAGLLPALLASVPVAQLPATRVTPPAPENVLVLVADDVGVDGVGAYAEHPDPGPTPNVDKLAARGVLFRNAWADPKCSPSRGTLVCGLYAFRTGTVEVSQQEENLPGLRLEVTTVPELLGPRWSTAALGKWHLGTSLQGPLHAVESGFGSYLGSRYNLGKNETPGDYFTWLKTISARGRLGPTGYETVVKKYATTDTADDAIAAVQRLPEPWFVYVAFNAPHVPFHDPPAHLHSYTLDPADPDLRVKQYKAMKEAMDREIGRILAVIPENTTVLFLGDNGTPQGVSTPPFDGTKAKGTVYEGGVNVPFIVAGPRVAEPGSECAALVNTTDLFATMADIAGVPNPSEDSISFLPYLADPDLPSRREYVYAELFSPIGFGPYRKFNRAVRTERYKLIRRSTRLRSTYFLEHELYDLWKDPFEDVDLLLGTLTPAQQAAYDDLSARMEVLKPTPGFQTASTGGAAVPAPR